MCKIHYYICKRCYHGYPQSTEVCDSMHPPLAFCPLHTEFKFYTVNEEQCHLYPIHAAPISSRDYRAVDLFGTGTQTSNWEENRMRDLENEINARFGIPTHARQSNSPERPSSDPGFQAAAAAASPEPQYSQLNDRERVVARDWRRFASDSLTQRFDSPNQATVLPQIQIQTGAQAQATQSQNFAEDQKNNLGIGLEIPNSQGPSDDSAAHAHPPPPIHEGYAHYPFQVSPMPPYVHVPFTPPGTVFLPVQHDQYSGTILHETPLRVPGSPPSPSTPRLTTFNPSAQTFVSNAQRQRQIELGQQHEQDFQRLHDVERSIRETADRAYGTQPEADLVLLVSQQDWQRGRRLSNHTMQFEYAASRPSEPYVQCRMSSQGPGSIRNEVRGNMSSLQGATVNPERRDTDSNAKESLEAQTPLYSDMFKKCVTTGSSDKAVAGRNKTGTAAESGENTLQNENPEENPIALSGKDDQNLFQSIGSSSSFNWCDDIEEALDNDQELRTAHPKHSYMHRATVEDESKLFTDSFGTHHHSVVSVPQKDIERAAIQPENHAGAAPEGVELESGEALSKLVEEPEPWQQPLTEVQPSVAATEGDIVNPANIPLPESPLAMHILPGTTDSAQTVTDKSTDSHTKTSSLVIEPEPQTFHIEKDFPSMSTGKGKIISTSYCPLWVGKGRSMSLPTGAQKPGARISMVLQEGNTSAEIAVNADRDDKASQIAVVSAQEAAETSLAAGELEKGLRGDIDDPRSIKSGESQEDIDPKREEDSQKPAIPPAGFTTPKSRPIQPSWSAIASGKYKPPSGVSSPIITRVQPSETKSTEEESPVYTSDYPTLSACQQPKKKKGKAELRSCSNSSTSTAPDLSIDTKLAQSSFTPQSSIRGIPGTSKSDTTGDTSATAFTDHDTTTADTESVAASVTATTATTRSIKSAPASAGLTKPEDVELAPTGNTTDSGPATTESAPGSKSIVTSPIGTPQTPAPARPRLWSQLVGGGKRAASESVQSPPVQKPQEPIESGQNEEIDKGKETDNITGSPKPVETPVETTQSMISEQKSVDDLATEWPSLGSGGSSKKTRAEAGKKRLGSL
ncbi:hypothetical protein F5Y15DRAFT_233688 [Xylariaceae sp. FL0016]|nr:hypothetical protein F5Y15DRAFT_233688 [Xylariaceae sp. FL0016]